MATEQEAEQGEEGPDWLNNVFTSLLGLMDPGGEGEEEDRQSLSTSQEEEDEEEEEKEDSMRARGGNGTPGQKVVIVGLHNQ